ncbi:MAG: hypothetical protein FGM32_04435 [Candidatus Kapabacteria bacterium]|nr:hypothetical protein [Candidatus Kapabacteria bacterium]
MWVHLIMARGFVRRRLPLWTLHVILVAAIASTCCLGALLLWDADFKIGEKSEGFSIDIVLRERVSGEQTFDLVSMLNRRPDVHSCNHLDRQNVWRIFQSEIGVESEGMAEIAALPEVIRIHFRREFVTNQHIHDVARSLKRRMPDRIESVMVPTLAINDVERERRQLENNLFFVAISGVLFVIILALVTGRSIRIHGQAAIASRAGRAARWMRLGPFLGMTAGTVIGLFLTCVGVLLIAPWLFLDLLEPYAMVAIAGTFAPVLLVTLVHAFMVIVPSTRQRGWQ